MLRPFAVLTPEAGARAVVYGPIRVSPWSALQLRRVYEGLRWSLDSNYCWGDFDSAWSGREWKGVALLARWRRRRFWMSYGQVDPPRSYSRAELMERYTGLQAVWGSGEGHGEGWVAYGAALVRDGVLRDLSAFRSVKCWVWGLIRVQVLLLGTIGCARSQPMRRLGLRIGLGSTGFQNPVEVTSFMIGPCQFTSFMKLVNSPDWYLDMAQSAFRARKLVN